MTACYAALLVLLAGAAPSPTATPEKSPKATPAATAAPTPVPTPTAPPARATERPRTLQDVGLELRARKKVQEASAQGERAALAVDTVSLGAVQSDGTVSVRGTVVNSGARPGCEVKVRIVVRDPAGGALGSTEVLTNPPDVGAGTLCGFSGTIQLPEAFVDDPLGDRRPKPKLGQPSATVLSYVRDCPF